MHSNRPNRKSDDLNFVLKDEQTNQARSVDDQTQITSKTLELFMTKPFDYLWNADYLSQQTKAELRAEAQLRGFIPAVNTPSYSPAADTSNQSAPPGPKPEPHKDNLGIG